MTICQQCNGKGAVINQTDISDPSGNTDQFQSPDGAVSPSTCQECNGKGYIGSMMV